MMDACIGCVPSMLDGLRRTTGPAAAAAQAAAAATDDVNDRRGKEGSKENRSSMERQNGDGSVGGCDDDDGDRTRRNQPTDSRFHGAPSGQDRPRDSRIHGTPSGQDRPTDLRFHGTPSDQTTFDRHPYSSPCLFRLGSNSPEDGDFRMQRAMFPLPIGKSSIGRSNPVLDHDISIDGAGVEDQHCYIINEENIVTLYPLAILTLVDGFRVIKPTRLHHGSLLCFGRYNYFRFHQPSKSQACESISVTQNSLSSQLQTTSDTRRNLIRLQSKPGALSSSQDDPNSPLSSSGIHSLEQSDCDQLDSGGKNFVNKVAHFEFLTHNVKRRLQQSVNPVAGHKRSTTHEPSRRSFNSNDVRIKKNSLHLHGVEVFPLENSETIQNSPEFESVYQPTHPSSTLFRAHPSPTPPGTRKLFPVQQRFVDHFLQFQNTSGFKDLTDYAANQKFADNDSDFATTSTESSSLSSSSFGPSQSKQISNVNFPSPSSIRVAKNTEQRSPCVSVSKDKFADLKAVILAQAAAKLERGLQKLDTGFVNVTNGSKSVNQSDVVPKNSIILLESSDFPANNRVDQNGPSSSAADNLLDLQPEEKFTDPSETPLKGCILLENLIQETDILDSEYKNNSQLLKNSEKVCSNSGEEVRNNLQTKPFRKPPTGKLCVDGKPSKFEKRINKSERNNEPSSCLKSLASSRSRSSSPKRDAKQIQDTQPVVTQRSEKDSNSLQTYRNNRLTHVVGIESVQSEENCSRNSLDSIRFDKPQENPWKVNLNQTLRPNLVNFKGEKIFTKDTATTNLVVGGLVQRNLPQTSVSKHQADEHLDSFERTNNKHTGKRNCKSDSEFAYLSDSGISRPNNLQGRCGEFSSLRFAKGKKSVTFSKENQNSALIFQKPESHIKRSVSLSKKTSSDIMDRGGTNDKELNGDQSEGVRTYLELVNTKYTNGRLQEPELKEPRKSSTSSGSPTTAACNLTAKATGSNNLDGKTMEEGDSEDISLSGSQQDLKDLYQKRKAERLQEQQMAVEEQRRLDDILKMCSDLGIRDESQVQPEKEVQPNGSLSKLAQNLSLPQNSKTSPRSSNSDEDVERDTIKRRPVPETIPSQPRFSSLHSSNLHNSRSQTTDVDVRDSGSDGTGSQMSPVADSGVDFCSPNWSRTGIERDFSASIRNTSVDDRRPPSTTFFTDTFKIFFDKPHNDYFVGNHSDKFDQQSVKHHANETWDDSGQQLRILKDFQRDVIQNIAEIKQKISETEAQQNEAVRELEVERALLEGEQQIQLEQLDAAEEKIASLERREAELLAEAADQRSKELEYIQGEKSKLIQLELRRRKTEEMLRKCSDEAESSMLEAQLQEDQDLEDNQRFLVDNLEFQQLEGESRYEEEKETIQNELKVEREELLSLCRQHQTTLQQIAAQQSDLLKQVDMDVFELEKKRNLLAEQFKKENTVLFNINQQMESFKRLTSHESPSVDSSSLARERFPLQWQRNADLASNEQASLDKVVLTNPTRRKPMSQTLPRLDSRHSSYNNRTGPNIFDEEQQCLSQIKARSSVLSPHSGWDRFSPGIDRRDCGAPWLNAGSDSDESSVSGSEQLSDKALSLSSKEDQTEKLREMECQLLIAKAEKLKLVEKQRQRRDSERDALEHERKRRRDLERRLAEEIARNNDVMEQTLKLRKHEKLQARPLTRYLPVRDRNLDLQLFIVSCGHNVDQCSHLAMTSTCCRGFLTKMGTRLRSWKKRWFVFDRTKRCLLYYADKTENKARGTIYFQAIEDVFVDHLHQVKSPTPQLTFCVKTYNRMYYLVAPSPDSMRIWIDVIFTGAEGYQQFA